jgi:NAD(P)-dependent dehydrogenase (short-subunit alcohol dehydrogenase family)
MQRGNDLQQQRVVVVGGSSGIGLAVAQQAATQGAKVVIVSSNAERVQKAVAGELLFLPRFLRILRPATIL